MNTKKSTIINAGSALITFIVQVFITFWLSPFVVSQLGEESYGFINLANNFVSYASLLAVLVNSMACRFISVEYNSGNYDNAKKYYSTVFIINTFLFSIIMLIAVLLINKLEFIINISKPIIFQVKLSFLLSFINMGISLLGTVFTSATFTTNKMHYNSVIQIIVNIIKSVLIFTLYTILPAKIYFFSIATLISTIITLICNYLISRKLFKDFEIKLKYFSFKKLIILLKSGFWVLISNLSNLLLNGLDLLFSNWFINTSIMGRLSLAKQIPYAFSNALGIFSNIFSSSLTKSMILEGDDGLIEDSKNQLKILTLVFTVPYAGIISYGLYFLKLWLLNSNYSDQQFVEVYILMIIILLDIIISTYMYSIHSIFIALDKVKLYSKILLNASIISISLTLLLLKTTKLGVYAISGTSTIILGFTHGIIVPILAAKLLKKPLTIFLKVEFKSWLILCITTLIYVITGNFLVFSDWLHFFLNIIILGIIGYIFSFILILNKEERITLIRFITKQRRGNDQA